MKTILGMLTSSLISPTIPVVDMGRAKGSTKQCLDLSNSGDNTSEVAIFECGKGTNIELYQQGPSKADQIVVTFGVSNIEDEANVLKGKGVYFEEYDIPEIMTQNGTATQGSTKSCVVQT